MMRPKGRIATLAVVCILLLGVGGGSYALAQSSTTDSQGTASGSTTSKGAKHNKGHKQKGEKRVRGQAIVKDKKASGGFATVTFDKGQLTSANNGQIALKEADGTNQTFTLGSKTKVRVDGKQDSASDLKPNMEVLVRTKQTPDQSSAEVMKVNARTSGSSSSGS